MAMPVVSIRYENPRAYIYSPFSGLPAVSEKDYDGGNKDDPTLLFTWFGNVGQYGYLSPRLQDFLGQNVEDIGGHKPPIQLDSSGHDVLSFRVITIAQFTLFASFVVSIKKTL